MWFDPAVNSKGVALGEKRKEGLRRGQAVQTSLRCRAEGHGQGQAPVWSRRRCLRRPWLGVRLARESIKKSLCKIRRAMLSWPNGDEHGLHWQLLRHRSCSRVNKEVALHKSAETKTRPRATTTPATLSWPNIDEHALRWKKPLPLDQLPPASKLATKTETTKNYEDKSTRTPLEAASCS